MDSLTFVNAAAENQPHDNIPDTPNGDSVEAGRSEAPAEDEEVKPWETHPGRGTPPSHGAGPQNLEIHLRNMLPLVEQELRTEVAYVEIDVERELQEIEQDIHGVLENEARPSPAPQIQPPSIIEDPMLVEPQSVPSASDHGEGREVRIPSLVPQFPRVPPSHGGGPINTRSEEIGHSQLKKRCEIDVADKETEVKTESRDTEGVIYGVSDDAGPSQRLLSPQSPRAVEDPMLVEPQLFGSDEDEDIYGISEDEAQPLRNQPPQIIDDPMLVEPQFFVSDSESDDEEDVRVKPEPCECDGLRPKFKSPYPWCSCWVMKETDI